MKSPSEIAEQIFEVWGDECERVGATTFSRHSLECLKGEIVKAIEAERARLTPPAEEEIVEMYNTYIQNLRREGAPIGTSYCYRDGFRAAFKWLEERE